MRRRLRLTAPVAGTVLPPPWTAERPEDPEGGLSSWSGTPLEPENRGAHLDDTVLFCQIGDPKKLEAIVVVDQGDIQFVHGDARDANGETVPQSGSRVDIKLDELPGETLHGNISEVSPSDLKVSSRRLSNKGGGTLATKTDASGAERPLSTSYQARVSIDDPDGLLRLGLRGQARIHSDGGQTLWQRAWLLTQAFSFKL